MKTELKPCPFCGSSAEKLETNSLRVKCSDFECNAHYAEFDIFKWNTRVMPWVKIESVNDLPIETDLWFHNGIDSFQSWVNICTDTGENYIVDNEDATHWMEIPKVDQGV